MGAPVPLASHKARTIISYFILYISTPEETLTRTTRASKREVVDKEKEKRKKWERERRKGGEKRQMEKEYREEKKDGSEVSLDLPVKSIFVAPSFFLPLQFFFFFFVFFSRSGEPHRCPFLRYAYFSSRQGWRGEVKALRTFTSRFNGILLCRLSLYGWLVKGREFLWDSDFFW